MRFSGFRSNCLVRLIFVLGLITAFAVPAGAKVAGHADKEAGRVPPEAVPGIIDTFIVEMKKYRPYQVVFRIYPKAEAELRAEIRRLAENYPSERFFEELLETGGRFDEQYYYPHLMSASDAATYGYLEHALTVLTSLEHQPAQCVAFFLGGVDNVTGQLDMALHRQDDALKAAMLESSLTDPSPPIDQADFARVSEMVVGSYTANGLDLESINVLEEVYDQDRKDAAACRSVITYMRAVLALPEKDASFISKSVLLIN